MTILIEPIAKFVSSSKLALMLKHLGWQVVHEIDVPDVWLWITDDRQPDPVFYNWRQIAMNKQVVNDVFKAVFGYEVGVDPELHVGKAVEKKLDHGTHGRVVSCPKSPQAGNAYQKLMANRSDGWLDEYRLDVFRSEMIVSLKHQVLQKNGIPQAQRTADSSEFDVAIADHFSDEEQGRLSDFCVEIGLDYGALDVVRHEDGRLYVIDATTNIGMPQIEWYKNLTLEQYIQRQASTFERNF